MRRIAVVLSFALPFAARAEEPKPSAEQLEFFEAKVRPILFDNCFQCHGEKKQQGGLRLDSRKAILAGGDMGPAAVPGEPAKSLLVKAINHADDLRMPEKKLPAEAIATLTDWVKLGLPFPAMKEIAKADPRGHWSYQPVKPTEPPATKTPTTHPVDKFILARLEAANQKMNPRADRRTLIRRLYFDLLGLPPDPKDVEEFVNDRDPQAYEKLVDKLLANPHYGERWGRYWLDYARYADTKGYVGVNVDRNYAYAYTYRDWVVKALNADMPYDRFVKLQIAADKLAPPDDPADLAAMGFLTVGRRFLNNTHDIIDDRIDVVCRTFLGLTVSCARCHDHKYDPIPTKDYYSMYGVFASSQEPGELPLLEKPKVTPESIAFEKELKVREDALNAFTKKTREDYLASLRTKEGIAKYLLKVRELGRSGNDRIGEQLQGSGLFAPVYSRYKLTMAKPEHAAVFGLWLELAALPDRDFADVAFQVIHQAPKGTHPLILKAFREQRPATIAEAAEVFGGILEKANATAKRTPEQESLAKFLTGPGGLAVYEDGDSDKFFTRADRNKQTGFKTKVDEWKAKSPAAPPRAMVMNDVARPGDHKVLVRGNPANQGAVVPRQFLEILTKDRKPFKDGSGRRELAEAIVSKDNPLTTRVIVNRVWQLHFGQGIVRTPSDFGIRSDPPTHPELLDYLADRFVNDGWSIKKLHKLLLTSAAWQQTSDTTASALRDDPENRLWSRANRRRLDFEALHDSVLATAGRLDGTVGGKAVDLFKEPYSVRRSIYGFVDRQNLPGTFRSFDFASPDQHSPQRFQTTVPQQALYLMNSPFLAEQAKALVERSEVARETETRRKAEELVKQVLGRSATTDEIAMALSYVQDAAAPTAAEKPVWQYGYGGYDPAVSRTTKFTALPRFNGTAWQGAEKLPDAKLGWASLNAAGGHPDGNPDRAVIRRWTTPTKAAVDIAFKLSHSSKDGDGMRGRVVSNKAGLLWEGIAKDASMEVTLGKRSLEEGEILDFIADAVGSVNNDSFAWSVAIKHEGGKTWDSVKDFAGPVKPKLDPWAQIAQALLLGNEYNFID